MSDHVSARFVSIATATGDAGASLEMVMPMETPTLFISYSHQDEAWKDRLQKQLAFLKIRLTAWDDRNISGGADWKSEIHEAMNQANLAILLVTPDFLCSEFIKTVEVPRLLERHRSGKLRLYPIIVSHCAFKRVDWLGALQCRPKDGQPLDKFFEESVVRGNEQLAMIADEIAGLLGASDEEMDEEVEAEATDDPLRLFAELVKKSGGVAKPPQDLDAAIQSGLTDIAETLSGLTARSRSTGLRLVDVERVVSTAIGHGAGVYNHSDAGRVGCARLYHRAAAGLLELMPEVSSSPDSRPPRDVDLAADWLRRIVMANPIFRERGADDLAWELRFAFDALYEIPLCDEILKVLAGLSLTGTERQAMSHVIGKVIERCQSMRQGHVGVYVLRHAAQVMLSRMDGKNSLDSDLIAVRDRLKAILSAHSRIVGANLAELGRLLPQAMAEAVQSLAAEENSPSRSQKRWFDPRVWFSQN